VEGDGFPRQLAAIEAYAATHGIQIVQVFREEGVSGTTDLEDRPALMAMLEALAANGTKLVLIERLDRLARDLMVQETIIGDLQKRGFQLISVMEPDLLADDPSRVLMRQIFGAIAQYEKAMIVAKLRGARQRTRQRTGRCEGRKPFANGEVIAHMRSLRQHGMSYAAIASQLNEEGVAAPNGGRWWDKSVNIVLHHSA
jgi:DNA invertase Pin-like site-specific DNA recombinase